MTRQHKSRRTGTRKARWLAAAAIGLTGAVLGVPAMAAPTPMLEPATRPVPISDYVTDPEGFLDASQTQQVQAASREAATQGVSPYYVVVPDFSGQDAESWCIAASNMSGLPGNAVVFALAYESRDATWCTELPENSSVISDAAIDRAIDGALGIVATSDPLLPEPAAEAGVYFATSVGANATGSATTPAPTSPAPSPGGSGTVDANSGANWSWFWILLLVVGALALFLVLRNRGKASKAPASGKVTAKQAEEAVAGAQQQLLLADEALRAAEDDVQFARAQFGAGKAEQFAAATQAARTGITDAFLLLPKMDEATSPADKYGLAQKVSQIVGTVMPPVKAAQDQVQALREREIGAEQQITQLRERVGEAREAIPREQQHLADLALRFSPTQLASLQDQPKLAAQFLDAAERHLSEAQRQLATDRSAAADSVDDAATQLALALGALDRVSKAEQTIGDSDRVLTAAIASITSDLNDVARLQVDQVAFGPLVSDAKAAITQGQQARSGQADPLAALEALGQGPRPAPVSGRTAQALSEPSHRTPRCSGRTGGTG